MWSSTPDEGGWGVGGGASLCCITATSRHWDNVKKKNEDNNRNKSKEERQNPGFLSLITLQDVNGITKSSTSPGCVLAKNRCTRYYSRKPIRAAAGQRSSNTVSTRAARINTQWRLSDLHSQVWKFVVTSDDNSTVTLHCCFFIIQSAQVKCWVRTMSSLALQEHDTSVLGLSSSFISFGCVLNFILKLFTNDNPLCRLHTAEGTLCRGTVWEDVFVTCHNYCCWSRVIL